MLRERRWNCLDEHGRYCVRAFGHPAHCSTVPTGFAVVHLTWLARRRTATLRSHLPPPQLFQPVSTINTSFYFPSPALFSFVVRLHSPAFSSSTILHYKRVARTTPQAKKEKSSVVRHQFDASFSQTSFYNLICDQQTTHNLIL